MYHMLSRAHVLAYAAAHETAHSTYAPFLCLKCGHTGTARISFDQDGLPYHNDNHCFGLIRPWDKTLAEQVEDKLYAQ